MLFTDMSQDHQIIPLSLAHWAKPPSTEASRCNPQNLAEKRNRPFFFPGVNEGEPHRLWSAKKPLGTLLCNALTVTGSPPFLTLPSPRAEGGLLCRSGYSPSRHPSVAPTSNRHADVSEPICSVLKGPHPNLMKPAGALSRCWSQCALHHAETRLCISLPFHISFIANIARKRPELNRDKTNHSAGYTEMLHA